jgi:two-component system response regulator NreC
MDSSDESETIRVVIADDHPLFREAVASACMVHGGVEVVGHAADGQDALIRTLELEPDVLVLDIDMPRKDGVRAAESMQRSAPHIPVLIVAAQVTDAQVRRLLGVNVRGIVDKHADGLEVIEAIQTVHRGHRYAPRFRHIIDSLEDEHEPGVLASLSDREYATCVGLARGQQVKEIAYELSISPSAVSTYRRRAMEKLGVKLRIQLFRKLQELGVTTADIPSDAPEFEDEDEDEALEDDDLG